MLLSPLRLTLALGLLLRTSSAPETATLGTYITAGAMVAIASNAS